jgi:phosphatidylserine decarboxylase
LELQMLRLYGTRFAGHLSHALGQVADIRMPTALLRPMIKAYSIAFQIEMDDVLEPEGGFECFGDFFVRRLRPDVRPICRDRDALLSPADGEVVDRGEISGGQSTTLQIKGSSYDVDQLLGDATDGDEFAGGGYLVVYLHPRDYHRVHCPVDGQLTSVCHIPGKHFPVASWSERRVKGVYGKNERMAYVLRPASGGTMALVMVAAFGVSNIETPFAPLGGAGNGRANKRCFDPQVRLSRGDDLGAFRLGSTVVLLWTPGAVEIDLDLVRDRVQVGGRIGKLCDGADGPGAVERE